MPSSIISVVEYSCGDDLYVVMHNGKQVVIAVDTGPLRLGGEPEPKPVIREFLPAMVLQPISTHPIYECSNEDRDLILAACDEAVTRHLSSLSDEP
jgi:hypothetical protein